MNERMTAEEALHLTRKSLAGECYLEPFFDAIDAAIKVAILYEKWTIEPFAVLKANRLLVMNCRVDILMRHYENRGFHWNSIPYNPETETQSYDELSWKEETPDMTKQMTADEARCLAQKTLSAEHNIDRYTETIDKAISRIAKNGYHSIHPLQVLWKDDLTFLNAGEQNALRRYYESRGFVWDQYVNEIRGSVDVHQATLLWTVTP